MAFWRRAAHFALLGIGGALGCDDGRLDVLEPLPAAGEAGASSTTGGSTGTGGSAGIAGSGGGATPTSPFVLDDFEDGDTQSLSIPEGFWYFKPDATCSGSFGNELIDGRLENTHAIRAWGGNCTEWGALLGLDLGGVGESFDTTSYDELRFWARAEPGTFMQISVSLLDPLHFDTVIDVTSEWREVVLPLDGFAFNDGGTARPFNRNAATHLQFFIFSPEPFDFWLDDLAFVRTE